MTMLLTPVRRVRGRNTRRSSEIDRRGDLQSILRELASRQGWCDPIYAESRIRLTDAPNQSFITQAVELVRSVSWPKSET